MPAKAKPAAKKAAAAQINVQPWNGLIHDVAGFRTASLHCGLKTAKEQPPDLALCCASPPRPLRARSRPIACAQPR